MCTNTESQHITDIRKSTDCVGVLGVIRRTLFFAVWPIISSNMSGVTKRAQERKTKRRSEKKNNYAFAQKDNYYFWGI